MTPRLLRAYRSTRYEADGIPIRVGQRSAAMDALLRQFGVRTAVLLTAWNPRSRRMPPEWNARMQRTLVERLRRLTSIPAEGIWHSWREAHVLVLADLARVQVAARLFRQSAVVALRIGQAPKLRIFRD